MKDKCPFCGLLIEDFDVDEKFRCDYCGCKVLYDKLNERLMDIDKEWLDE